MPLARIHPGSTNKCYFLTPTIWNWYYIFDRHNRWQILADSLKYCQEQKGLIIFSYVFMLNHMHMIVQSDDVSGFIRDFKKYTSKRLRENLKEHEPNVLELFLDEKMNYRFWKEDNQPKMIENDKFFYQKCNYIHDNPVRKGYVDRPENWKWSSANPRSEIRVMRF